MKPEPSLPDGQSSIEFVVIMSPSLHEACWALPLRLCAAGISPRARESRVDDAASLAAPLLAQRRPPDLERPIPPQILGLSPPLPLEALRRSLTATRGRVKRPYQVLTEREAAALLARATETLDRRGRRLGIACPLDLADVPLGAANPESLLPAKQSAETEEGSWRFVRFVQTWPASRRAARAAPASVHSGSVRGVAESDFYVERQNLTMRMSMRRFTPLTNGHSKKIENHIAAATLHFTYYNFCRVHMSLGKDENGKPRTPAMAAGVEARKLDIADLIALLPDAEVKPWSK